MTPTFYVRQAGQISGPYSTSDIQRMARDGDVTQATDLCLTDAGNWFKAAKLQGLVFQVQEVPAPGAADQKAAAQLSGSPSLVSAPSQSRILINETYPPPPPLPVPSPDRKDSTNETNSNTPSTDWTGVTTAVVIILIIIACIGGKGGMYQPIYNSWKKIWEKQPQQVHQQPGNKK